MQSVNPIDNLLNYYVAGRRGVYTGSSGLCVAYLSGLDGTKGASDQDTHFSAEDIDSLTLPLVSDSKFKGVDILLTSEWPKGTEKYASEAVSWLLTIVQTESDQI